MSRTWSLILLLGAAGCSAEPANPVVEFIAELQQGDDDSRFMAAKSLGDLGPAGAEAALPLVEAFKKDRAIAVRIEVAYALAKIGPDAASAVPALTEALTDRDREVRLGAAYALPAMGPGAASALAALQLSVQRDADAEVRAQAVKSIRIIDMSVKHQNVSPAQMTSGPPDPSPPAKRRKKKF